MGKQKCSSINELTEQIRNDLDSCNWVLIYAYNKTGKTRLSMEFKDREKSNNSGNPTTFYFNAFTEDLFTWDNDLENDRERKLYINHKSKFSNAFREGSDLDSIIKNYFHRYTDLDADIQYNQAGGNGNGPEHSNESLRVVFSRQGNDNIKVSRGEETLFIFCVYLAICDMIIESRNNDEEADSNDKYSWVKYFYIDDPVSSLDENNAINIACDLANLLRKGKGKIKAIISSHHSLFFNIMYNEFKKSRKAYFLQRKLEEFSYKIEDKEIINTQDVYYLQSIEDTPFFEHIAMLCEIKQAIESDKLYTYHFNIMRGILEKTASFFGYDKFSKCIMTDDSNALFADKGFI